MEIEPSDNSMPQLDRTAFAVSDHFDDPDEKAYWLSRTPQERLRHMELLRRINYGSAALGPMQKVFEIVERDLKEIS